MRIHEPAAPTGRRRPRRRSPRRRAWPAGRDLVGRADLLDAALVQDGDAVGELQRLVLVVGDEDGGVAGRVVELAQPAAQLLAHLGVERAERLVEQQHPRLDRERAGQRDALALAAGELAGIAVLPGPSSWTRSSRSVDAAADLALRPGALAPRPHPQAEGDVVEHGHVAEQRVVLEDEADMALAHGAGAWRPRRRTARAPASACSSPAMMRSSVVLPEPDGPSSATQLAWRDCRGRRPRSAGERPKRLGDALGCRDGDGACAAASVRRAARRVRRA